MRIIIKAIDYFVSLNKNNIYEIFNQEKIQSLQSKQTMCFKYSISNSELYSEFKNNSIIISSNIFSGKLSLELFYDDGISKNIMNNTISTNDDINKLPHKVYDLNEQNSIRISPLDRAHIFGAKDINSYKDTTNSSNAISNIFACITSISKPSSFSFYIHVDMYQEVDQYYSFLIQSKI